MKKAKTTWLVERVPENIENFRYSTVGSLSNLSSVGQIKRSWSINVFIDKSYNKYTNNIVNVDFLVGAEGPQDWMVTGTKIYLYEGRLQTCVLEIC